MLTLTQAQLDALYQVYLRWQNTTPRAIMPEEYELISDDDARCNDGSWHGVWVGGPPRLSRSEIGTEKDRGRMYLGIERDGHTHS